MWLSRLNFSHYNDWLAKTQCAEGLNPNSMRERELELFIPGRDLARLSDEDFHLSAEDTDRCLTCRWI